MGSTRKLPSLNPNAAEFLPFSLKSPSGSTSIADGATSSNASGTKGKAVLNRTESSISNNSDEESHEYWCQKLPDDIIPDFKAIEEEGSRVINSLPFSTLSLRDGNQTSRALSLAGGGFLLKEPHNVSPHGSSSSIFSNQMRRSMPPYGEDGALGSFLQTTDHPWDKSTVRDGSAFNSKSTHGLVNEQGSSGSSEMSVTEFLASRFPGVASETLAEVYLGNGRDIRRTVEMLKQLELDNGLNQNLNSKALSAPNLTAMEFALSMQDTDENDLRMFRSSSSIPTRGAADFPTAFTNMPPPDGGIWKFERKGSANAGVGSSRSSQVLASSFNSGQERGIFNERFQPRGSPVRLGAAEAVANIYSELQDEVLEHARLREAYMEQAKNAHLLKNIDLAKELYMRANLHGAQMKAAENRALEAIRRQRSLVGPAVQNNRSQERVIDVQGLPVNEAKLVLQRELAALRNLARSTDQRLQVFVCLGAGHQVRGSRMSPRFPVAIQRYLIEEEGLDYTEPQPGVLRVLVY